ncbi:MAG: DUF4234 domain-containing protein [Candidatus Pacearchaeota archaeon]
MEKNESIIEEGVPKKFNVFLLVLLSIITLGVYSYIWYIINGKKLNNLKTKSKINNKIPLISLIVFLIIIILTIALITIAKLNVINEGINATTISDIPIQFTIIFTINIALITTLCILTLFLAFRTRKILNETLENKGEKVKISGFFSLIFNLFYLQYEINRIIDDKENNKRLGPWIVFAILILTLILPLTIILILVYVFKKSIDIGIFNRVT